ncbi:hypothetical protein APHAL10511_008219 [Amanita phalloides]|nr:hypothetical protein APHAL10511_008219 [Amanita phalloides]
MPGRHVLRHTFLLIRILDKQYRQTTDITNPGQEEIMVLTPAQKNAIEEILDAIISTTGPRGKRQISAMFMHLVDRTEWRQYYEVIPEPRCLNNIRAGLAKNRYKDARDVYKDISLVFWNALYYNEPGSQITSDAKTLKTVLESEWKKKSVLPSCRSSPPPSSAQKVHRNLVTSRPSPGSDTIMPHTRSKNEQRHSTPEMDVDIMTSEYDAQGNDGATGPEMERDPESEEIVKQLEKGLPQWPGFGEEGWMREVTADHLLEIVLALKSHKDATGSRVAGALESVPEESTIPYLSYRYSLSLKIIEDRARSKLFNSAKEFDMEMARLFEKARRCHEPTSEGYGRALLLQRLYHAITSGNPPPGPPYTSSTNFASLKAGPGTTKPVHGADSEGVPGVTTYRVIHKDRTFVDELHYKGWSVRLADWVHLSNPDDPSRPIIAQIFRCWVSEEPSKKGQQGLTVSWYYRPEQTFHSADRNFWEGEVFKTSHFADHPLEDLIEKIACQFTARHIRGRPRPPYWYLGFPLYVCDSRYNDRDRVFVRIKNWNSCIPEEVRKSTEFMPIYPFERTVFPRRFPSPFLTKDKGAIKAPGGIMDVSDATEVDKAKKPRKGAADNGPNKGIYVGSSTQSASSVPVVAAQSQPSQTLTVPQRSSMSDRSIVTAAGGVAVLGNENIERLPPETVKHFDRDPETNEVLWFAAPPMNMARVPAPQHSLAYLHYQATRRKRKGDEIDPDGHPSTKKRSIPSVTEILRATLKDVPLP